MIALVVIAAILIYVTIGCVANIIAARLNLVDYKDDECFELMCALMFAWPITLPLALVTYFVLKFQDYLKNIDNHRK